MQALTRAVRLLPFLWAFAPTLPTQTHSVSDAIPRSITSAVNQSVTTFLADAPHAAALSIGVFKDGESYFYNFGALHRDSQDLPSSDTLYPIASISKTFTGTLLAQAVVEKNLRLTDDVRQYLPGAYPNLEYQGQPVQLQFLVNHTSGLPFNLPNTPENRPPFTDTFPAKTRNMLDHYSRSDFLRDLHAVRLTAVPGHKFSYSNAGAVLLSIMLERVYGEPYETIIQQKIARPLGMKDTTISLSRSQRRRLAPGYDQDGPIGYYPPIIMLGAAGLKSTASDLLKYAVWETAESDEAVRLSHTPRLILAPDYALGLNWQISQKAGGRRIWQEGSVPGFLSFCSLFPQQHMAIVVLSNENDPATSRAFDQIARSIAESVDPRSATLF